MTRTRSFRLEENHLSFLELEAEKSDCTVNDVVKQFIEDAMKGNPIISKIVDIDLQIKQKTLEEKIEKIRERKYRNDYVEKNGYYPPRGALHVKVVEQKEQKPTEKVWYGSSYGQEQREPPKKDFSQFMPKKEITPEQWDRIYSRTVNELSSGKFGCGICAVCIFEKLEDLRSHLHTVHGSELLKIAKEFGFT